MSFKPNFLQVLIKIASDLFGEVKKERTWFEMLDYVFFFRYFYFFSNERVW